MNGAEIDVGKPVQGNIQRVPLAITSKPELGCPVHSQRKKELAATGTLNSHLDGRSSGGLQVNVKIPIRIVLHVSEIGNEDSHSKPSAPGNIERPAVGSLGWSRRCDRGHVVPDEQCGIGFVIKPRLGASLVSQ